MTTPPKPLLDQEAFGEWPSTGDIWVPCEVADRFGVDLLCRLNGGRSRVWVVPADGSEPKLVHDPS